MADHRVRGTLAQRLALSFLGVALAAVAALAGLTVIFATSDVSRLVTMQRDDLTGAIAAAAGAAWDRHHSWSGADLGPTLELASRTGADAQIRGTAGQIVAQSSSFAAQAGQPQFRAVIDVREKP